jgi:hypothetical protein
VDFAIYAISRLQFIKKKCNGFITYNGIEGFSTNLRHAIVSRVMTLRSKKFGNYEICDGLYSSLLYVIKILKIQSSSHIQKNVFHDQY